MTAATTPTAASRGDWAWPLKPPAPVSQSTSAPLELLQFLPPSTSTHTSATRPAPASSPWTVDPSRLQKLMMGSSAAAGPSPSSTIASRSALAAAPVPDFGAFFDPGINKPLPSGWERCLDLKSGEVFIKKSEAMKNNTEISPRTACWQAVHPNDMNQLCTRPSKICDRTVQSDKQRVDWSPSWVAGKNLFSNTASKGLSAFVKVEAKVAYGEEERLRTLDRQPLCLDLDLRLTNDHSSRLASEAPEFGPSPSFKPASSVSSLAMCSRDFSSHGRMQAWKWQPAAQENERPAASIQEMVSESTMATAVCSKCLMYVLLKKSNPTCPRCFNPIILDCGAHTSSVKKRPRLELSPDDLSLSTDSSR